MLKNKKIVIVLIGFSVAAFYFYIRDVRENLSSKSTNSKSERSSENLPNKFRNLFSSSSDLSKKTSKELEDMYHAMKGGQRFEFSINDVVQQYAASQGFDKTLAFLNEVIGAGSERDSLMRAVFSGLTEDMGVSSDRLEGLGTAARSFAKQGLFSRIDERNLKAAEIAKFFSSPYINDGEHDIFRYASQKFGAIKSQSEAKKELAKLVQAADLSTSPKKREMMISILGLAGNSIAFDSLEVMSTLEQTTSVRFSAEDRRTVITGLIDKYPDRAVELLSKEGAEAEDSLAWAIGILTINNPIKTEELLKSGKLKKTPKVLAGIQRGKAMAHQNKQEFADAINQAEAIEDPTLRAKHVEEFRKYEIEGIKRSYTDNPHELLIEVVEGKSKYSELSIETALSMWVDKDPVAADEWYQKNGSHLNPNQSQYVASSFALQAARQGDLELAKQWAGKIKDDATLQRVNAEIEKKGGE